MRLEGRTSIHRPRRLGRGCLAALWQLVLWHLQDLPPGGRRWPRSRPLAAWFNNLRIVWYNNLRIDSPGFIGGRIMCPFFVLACRRDSVFRSCFGSRRLGGLLTASDTFGVRGRSPQFAIGALPGSIVQCGSRQSGGNRPRCLHNCLHFGNRVRPASLPLAAIGLA
jgi:hypothetical protein